MNRRGFLAASYNRFDMFAGEKDAPAVLDTRRKKSQHCFCTGEGMPAFSDTDHEKVEEAGNDDAGTAIIPL